MSGRLSLRGDSTQSSASSDNRYASSDNSNQLGAILPRGRLSVRAVSEPRENFALLSPELPTWAVVALSALCPITIGAVGFAFIKAFE